MLLHTCNLGFQCHDLCFARVCVHLEVVELLAGLRYVLLQCLKLRHEGLDLITELAHIRHSLLILGLLRFSLFYDTTDTVLQLTFELFLDLSNLRLMSAHLFLVVLLVLAILLNL